VISEPLLRFQSNAIKPVAVLGPDQIQPGDILLTADPTFISVSIRAMTFAPVSHAAVYLGMGNWPTQCARECACAN